MCLVTDRCAVFRDDSSRLGKFHRCRMSSWTYRKGRKRRRHLAATLDEAKRSAKVKEGKVDRAPNDACELHMHTETRRPVPRLEDRTKSRRVADSRRTRRSVGAGDPKNYRRLEEASTRQKRRRREGENGGRSAGHAMTLVTFWSLFSEKRPCWPHTTSNRRQAAHNRICTLHVS